MRLAKIIAGAGLLAVLLAGCGGFTYHRVQPGETLYSISWRYGMDYREVARWNGLKSPYTVYEGQQLRIIPPADTLEETEPVAVAPAAIIAPTVPPPRQSPPPLPSRPHAAAGPPRWQWPVQGTLLQTFSDTESSRKGIDISGSPGQAVRAAAAGKVVYAGSGLLHYGNLIILKHDDNYLSAYAYNRVLRVHEGDTVVAGQHIADMGGRNAGTAMLHFEIRYDGRPVNPLKYLPSARQ